MPTLLDTSQIVKRVYDDQTDAIRVDLNNLSQVAVALDASEDSITVHKMNLNLKVQLTFESDTILIPAFSAGSFLSMSFFAKVSQGSASIQLQGSPSTTDDEWYNISTEWSVEASPKTVAIDHNFMRLRLIVPSKSDPCQVTLYIVARG